MAIDLDAECAPGKHTLFDPPPPPTSFARATPLSEKQYVLFPFLHLHMFRLFEWWRLQCTQFRVGTLQPIQRVHGVSRLTHGRTFSKRGLLTRPPPPPMIRCNPFDRHCGYWGSLTRSSRSPEMHRPSGRQDRVCQASCTGTAIAERTCKAPWPCVRRPWGSNKRTRR